MVLPALNVGVRGLRRISALPVSGYALPMVDGKNDSRHCSHRNEHGTNIDFYADVFERQRKHDGKLVPVREDCAGSTRP